MYVFIYNPVIVKHNIALIVIFNVGENRIWHKAVRAIFVYDLEMKMSEDLIGFIERVQMRVAFGWWSERPGEKMSSSRTF